MLVPFLDSLGQYHLYRLRNGSAVECRDALAVFMCGKKADQLFVLSSSPWCTCLGTLRSGLLRRCRRFPLLAAVAVAVGIGASSGLGVGVGISGRFVVSIQISRGIL